MNVDLTNCSSDAVHRAPTSPNARLVCHQVVAIADVEGTQLVDECVERYVSMISVTDTKAHVAVPVR
jgi:hypothetical protein